MKVVIIFTGEYHNAIHDVSGASSESFFSDIEILLTQEPVVGIPRTDPRNAAAAGYNIELHHRETYQTGESHHTQFSKVSTGGIKGQVVVETRPFCRVLKSRFSQIQSRRCSYQILPGEGFHFDEIFPGDGYMLLFEDNPKQREDWLDFLLKDCPHEFPALRFELFDRTHQQRVFSTERCFSGHRQHTDLHLASFDTYWIKWFIELNERSIIGRNLRPLRERIMRHFKERGGNDPEDDTRKLFSKAICHLHFKFLDKSAKDWKAKLRTLLPKLGLRIDPAEIDEMLSDEQVDKGIRGCCDELKGRRGILEPIPKGELRLFGEQRSELLADLMNQHPYLENEGMLLSVPFNANISYLVLREDLLDRFADEVGKAEDAQKQWEFLEKIERLLKREREAIAKFSSACPLKVRRKWENKRDQSMLSGDPGANPNEDAQRLLEIKGRLGKGYRPKTWEEIIILCEAYQWEYVVETRSFDTLLCTFLEMLWSCGADLAVNPEYTVNVEGGMIRLYQSVFLFQELLKHVPANSTVDAKGFVENATFRSKSGKVDWAFMRQWHSTFVDMLVAKNADETDYIWKPEPPPGLKIAPLPESFWQFYRKDRDKQRGYGVSSWGDWHLAVLRGSENKSLAVGLLNNMMASSKIANRALQGAALPAVEKFYDIYGDDQCLTLPERGALKMPRQTFNDLKNELFPIAKSRSNIFDYRHCMREIHGFVLELVHARGEKKPEEVCKALQGVFGRIKKLSERELMLH